MSRKFYAVDRVTGERWKSSPNYKEYLVMYDSGYLAVITNDGFYTHITPLNNRKWKKVLRGENNDE